MKLRHNSVPGVVHKEIINSGGLSAVKRTQLHEGSTRGRINSLESFMWRATATVNQK